MSQDYFIRNGVDDILVFLIEISCYFFRNASSVPSPFLLNHSILQIRTMHIIMILSQHVHKQGSGMAHI